MGMLEHWRDDPKPLDPVKNENLVCGHCMNATNKVASCSVYQTKPLSVLKGGVCYEYKKK